MDDRRIARALAGTEGPDAAERARRRWARWRIVLRAIAIVCILAAAVLAGILLRPMPRQAALQYTQGTLRLANWSDDRGRHFVVGLDHETRVYEVDPELAERAGRKLTEIARPGMTARIGYSDHRSPLRGRLIAWDFVVDGQTIYSLADIRARAARQAPPNWLLISTLLAVGVLLWWLTPRRSRSPRHRGRESRANS
ncbi:MAG: hypothetical protein QOE14_261 [Humisphaera sp.]|nr:hypothetical protein [Humisphaera sp.]